jgi:hypothetical protein
MEPKDFKSENLIFKSNEDILERYGDIFDREVIDEKEYFLEKDCNLEDVEIFRFFLIPSGIIAISSSTDIPEDKRDVWELNTELPTVKDFLRFLNVFVEERIFLKERKLLQGSIPYPKGYSYRIYTYNNQYDSEILKDFLDQRRMGYILNQYTRD